MAQKVFHGIGVSEGVRIAKALVYRQPVVDLDRNIPPESVQTEIERLRAAVKAATDDVTRLLNSAEGVIGKDKLGVLKGQKSILVDPSFIPEAEKQIEKQYFSAEKAVRQRTDKFAALFSQMPNPYLQERAADVRDAGNRLIRFLSGAAGPDLAEINSEVILVADDLSASDTVQLNRKFVCGFATETGGRTAHTSIFAKAMEIPAVVGAPGLLQSIRNGDPLILDGTEGVCILSPDMTTLAEYQQKYESEQRRRAAFSIFKDKQAALADGGRIVAAANIGSASDVELTLKQGAEAVGLMRTELLFLSRAKAPTEEEQFAEYKKVAQGFAAKQPGEVIIRTLDIGGDKAADYLQIPKEANPFLGFRAIRLCLARRELFLTQLRAILRASAFGHIKIMFPMIADLSELHAAMAALQEAKSQLDAAGISYDAQIKAGIMVETPAAALMADVLAGVCDFFSIGTNDLTQYTLAADRGNPQVSYLYDYFNPAVLRLIRQTAQAARARKIPVGMCGGMAGDPIAIPLLVGLGLDELSMAPGAISQAKYILNKLTKAECERQAEAILSLPGAQDARKAAMEFARHRCLL